MKLSNGERLFHWPLDYHVITAGWTHSSGKAQAEGKPYFSSYTEA